MQTVGSGKLQLRRFLYTRILMERLCICTKGTDRKMS